MVELIKRLRDPQFGTETSERNLMNAAADALEATDTRIAQLEAALSEFQQHVIRHSCSWDDAENASHHHPIWAKVAGVLEGAAALRAKAGQP